MKRKFSIFVIPAFAIILFSSCLYKGTDKPQTLQEEMILITQRIRWLEGEGHKVDTTALGVFYWVVKPGPEDGLYPEMGDTLTVIYDGYLIDGTLFYSTNILAEKERTFILGEEDAVAGWNDGLKVIKKGSTVELIIPSTLGFGNNWNGDVPPNNTMVFIVEMKNIKQKKD